MIIIGEKLNSSIKSSRDAMRDMLNGDDSAVVELIRRQEAAGARYLDVNTAMFAPDEYEVMERVIKLIHKHSGCLVMPDSPDIDVLYKAARLCEGRCLVNSFTADNIAPLIEIMSETGCLAVVLPTESGTPDDAHKRFELAKSALSQLNAAGIASSRVYVDILSESLAVNQSAAINALETLRLLKTETDAMTICGVSNISFGLPKRMLINSAFLVSATIYRLDAAILDPCRRELADTLHAAAVVAGQDTDCVEYINFVREEYL